MYCFYMYIIYKMSSDSEEDKTIWEQLGESDDVNTDRRIKLCSLGEDNMEDRKIDTIDRVFDLRKFSFEFPNTFERKYDDGMNEEFQNAVANAERFEDVIRKIVTYIEENDCQSIGIMCRTGKLHSVSFVEMLKHELYSKAIVNHVALNSKQRR